MQDIKKGKFDNEQPENYTQVKEESPVTATRVKPEKSPMEDMGDMNDNGMGESTEIEIDSNALPALKKWELGKKYPVNLILSSQELAEDGKTVKGKFKLA